MSIGKRIKELRKNYLRLNQTDFATPLGLNQSTIGGYENDFRSVSDATILSICRQYGVREEWLRYGTGEIFSGSSIAPSDLAELAKKYDLDKYDQALIMEYMKLEKPVRERLKQKIREIFLDDDSDIDQEVESYREELKTEKRKRDMSSASDTTNAKEA